MNLEDIAATLGIMTRGAEVKLRSKLTEISGKPSQDSTDMIDLQSTMYGYTMAMETNSTAMKIWYDSIEKIIQKTG